MCVLQQLRVSVHEQVIAVAEDVLEQLKKASKPAALRALLTERLTAAAQEIVGLFEEALIEYQDRVRRSQEQICRQEKLLDAVLKPEVRLRRANEYPLFPHTESKGASGASALSPHNTSAQLQNKSPSSQSGEEREDEEEAADSGKWNNSSVSLGYSSLSKTNIVNLTSTTKVATDFSVCV